MTKFPSVQLQCHSTELLLFLVCESNEFLNEIRGDIWKFVSCAKSNTFSIIVNGWFLITQSASALDSHKFSTIDNMPYTNWVKADEQSRCIENRVGCIKYVWINEYYYQWARSSDLWCKWAYRSFGVRHKCNAANGGELIWLRCQTLSIAILFGDKYRYERN